MGVESAATDKRHSLRLELISSSALLRKALWLTRIVGEPARRPAFSGQSHRSVQGSHVDNGGRNSRHSPFLVEKAPRRPH